MKRAYEKFPELIAAKREDLRQLTEEKIDKILESQQSNHKTLFSDFKNEAISTKSIYQYVSKSAKQLFSLMNGNSKLKKSSPDTEYLQAILNNQKILASLIIQQTKNKKQLNEMISDTK